MSPNEIRWKLVEESHNAGNSAMANAFMNCLTESDVRQTLWQSYGVGSEEIRRKWSQHPWFSGRDYGEEKRINSALRFCGFDGIPKSECR